MLTDRTDLELALGGLIGAFLSVLGVLHAVA